MRVLVLLCVYIFVGCFTSALEAQTADTIQLKTVDISETRAKLFSKGSFITSIDSGAIAASPHLNMAEVLSGNTSAFIKSYSPGGSSTLSVRGTEARHNAVLWNGFNINSTSLGLSDLSTIPSFISDHISLISGGSAPVNGNSALGSTLVLENDIPDFNGKSSAGINFEAGSFNNYHTGLQFKTGNKFIYTKSVVFYEKAQNDFEFVNFTRRDRPTVKQNNASYTNWGLIQNFDFKLNKRSFLSSGIWYQVYDRELPPQMTSAQSYASQRDSILRISLAYKLLFAKSTLLIKGAFFREFQFYDDTKTDQHNRYLMNSYLSEAELRVQLNPNLILNSGVSYINNQASISEYQQQQHRTMFALFSGLLYEPFHGWKFNLNLRKEFTNIENPPISPSLGITGEILKNVLSVFGNIGRHYNLPSMNDLYWQPGGNKNLKPEDAWSEELGFIITDKNKKLPKITFTFFNSSVENWIKWLPGASGIYTPDNLRQVHMQGIESAVNYQKNLRNVNIKLIAHYTFCTSSVTKVNTPQEEITVSKQLMYVPKHIFNGVIYILWHGYSLNYNHTFTGERFTTSDNYSSLEPYTVANLSLEKGFLLNKYSVHLYGKIMNLYDSAYQVLAFRPMPGRWYSAGIKFHIQYNTKINN